MNFVSSWYFPTRCLLTLSSGNPQRYKNRSILRMVPDKAVPFENQQLGVPGKGTQTEAEDHLKDMLKTQLETNVTFQR